MILNYNERSKNSLSFDLDNLVYFKKKKKRQNFMTIQTSFSFESICRKIRETKLKRNYMERIFSWNLPFKSAFGNITR